MGRPAGPATRRGGRGGRDPGIEFPRRRVVRVAAEALTIIAEKARGPLMSMGNARTPISDEHAD